MKKLFISFLIVGLILGIFYPPQSIFAGSLLLNETCDDVTSWTDGDVDTGVSEVSPAGQFRFDSNSSALNNGYAWRYKTIASPPNLFTVEIKTYFDSIGTLANGDQARFVYTTATWRILIDFASDGLFIYKTGGGTTEVGTNIVKYGGTAAWQTWRFQVNKSSGEASATVEVFLENVSQGTFDCDYEVSGTNGRVGFLQYGFGTNDMVSHANYIKIATGLGKISHPAQLIF